MSQQDCIGNLMKTLFGRSYLIFLHTKIACRPSPHSSSLFHTDVRQNMGKKTVEARCYRYTGRFNTDLGTSPGQNRTLLLTQLRRRNMYLDDAYFMVWAALEDVLSQRGSIFHVSICLALQAFQGRGCVCEGWFLSKGKSDFPS